MRRSTPLFACALAACAAFPATASAEPKILKAEVSHNPLAGQLIGVHVEARDSAQAINGVEVRIPGKPGKFGISACGVGKNGKVKPTPGVGAGKNVTFNVPYVPAEAGLQSLEVEVTSGACGELRSRAQKKVNVKIGLAEVPPLPTPQLPGNGQDEVVDGPRAKGSQVGCPGIDTLPTRKNLAIIRGAIICLINQQRAARNLELVHTHVGLRKAALRHSRDMLRRSFFDHEGPSGPTFVDRLRRVGYWPASASENLGEGAAVLASPKAMIVAWMMSEGHRENILGKRYRDVGVGVALGLQGESTPGAMYTVDFGRR